MWLRRARVPVTPVLSNLLTALLGGAGIWWWLLTSQSGSSEPCLKGPIWHLSCGGAPESLEEPPVLLIFIRRAVMRNSLADSSERLAPLLISGDAHFDIKKQRRPRPPPPPPSAAAISRFCFSVSCCHYPLALSLLPRSQGGLHQSVPR